MTRVEDVSPLFVAQKRALNASWASVSRMTGASEVALRRRFEPGFTTAHPTFNPSTSPRETVRLALVKAGLNPDSAAIIAKLWQANGARMTPKDLIQGIAGTPLASHMVADAKRAAMRRGITFAPAQKGTGGQALTPEAVVMISELAGTGGTQ